MTTQQQTALINWKEKEGTSALPTILENVLINRILEELQNNENLIDKMCKHYKKEVVKIMKPEFGYNSVAFCHPEGLSGLYTSEFHRLSEINQKEYIMYFLSKGVMPFLDVETNKYKNLKNRLEKEKRKAKKYEESKQTILAERCEGLQVVLITEIEYTPKTLANTLYNEFNEALRVHKTVDEAYKIINLIYLQNA